MILQTIVTVACHDFPLPSLSSRQIFLFWFLALCGLTSCMCCHYMRGRHKAGRGFQWKVGFKFQRWFLEIRLSKVSYAGTLMNEVWRERTLGELMLWSLREGWAVLMYDAQVRVGAVCASAKSLKREKSSFKSETSPFPSPAGWDNSISHLHQRGFTAVYSFITWKNPEMKIAWAT